MGHAYDVPRLRSYRFSWPTYVALVLLAFLVNYPGRLDPDTIDMVTIGEYPSLLHDWHAPVLTWLYSIFAPVLGQPAGALLTQALLIFVYAAVVPVRSGSEPVTIMSVGATVASGIFAVALIAIAGQIVKDPVAVGATLCLLGAIDLSRNSPDDGRWLAVKLALLLLILAIRPVNFMILATAGVICAYFAFGWGRLFIFAVILNLLICASSVPVLRYIDRHVLGARHVPVEHSLIIFDAAGISTDLKRNLFTELPGWPADKARPPWECYTSEKWNVFKWGACSEYAVLFDEAMKAPGAPRSAVRWWLNVILSHPVSYMKHRVSYTFQLLRGGRPVMGWTSASASNAPGSNELFSEGSTHGIDMTQSIKTWKPWLAYVPFGWISASIFSRPASAAWGLLFCLTTLLWNWHCRSSHQKFDLTAVVSSAIGLGNVVMFAAVGVSADGRYTTVVLACGIVSLLRTIGDTLFQARCRTWVVKYFIDPLQKLVFGGGIAGQAKRKQ
jgi:hypothetical protein